MSAARRRFLLGFAGAVEAEKGQERPVVFVIILWKVLPGEANRRALFDCWAKLELSDRSGLVGEYLSQPLLEFPRFDGHSRLGQLLLHLD